MTETLQKKSMELAEKIVDLISNGIDAAPGVIQDLANEYVRLKLVAPIVWSLASLVGAVAGAMVLRWGVEITRKNDEAKEYHSRSDANIPCFMLGGALLITSIICFFTQSIEALEIVLAPKAYLIEFLRAGAGGGCR